MSDDLIAGAKWTLENAAGMTLENEEVRQLCDMADRIEELEAKLAKAKHTLRCVDRRMNDLGGYDGRFSLRKLVSITLAELTGGKDE